MEGNRKRTIHQIRIAWHSIQFRIAFYLMVFLLVLSMGVLASNILTMNQERQMVTEYNARILKLYISQTDLNLSSLDSYIQNVFASDENLPMFNGEAPGISTSDQILAIVRFRMDISGMLQQFYWLHSFYIHVPEQTRSFLHYKGTLTHDFQVKVGQYVQTLSGTEGWHAAKIGDDYYYLHPYRSGKVMLCALVSMENMLSQMELLDEEFSRQFLLMNQKGEILYGDAPEEIQGLLLNTQENAPYVAGRWNQYTIISEPSSIADLNAVVACPHVERQRSLQMFRMIMLIVLAYILLAGAFMFLLMHKTVFQPLKDLQKLSNEILRGNFNYRLSTNSPYEEFSDTNRSINKMLDRIEHLRVSVYEEQLRSQQMEISKLQQEIKPHFLLNSLNLVYNMALEKDYEMIKAMCLSLSRYFRYRIHSERNLVPLSEEVDCVRSYLSIQQFRFPDDFDFVIDIEPEANDAQVVPLMIQTFAENSILHALKSTAHIFLKVQATIIQYGGSKALNIEISDTGSGYPEQVLKDIKKESEGQSVALGIGISNIQRRLKLVFSSQARLLLSNDPATGGAHTTIITPLILTGKSTSKGG